MQLDDLRWIVDLHRGQRVAGPWRQGAASVPPPGEWQAIWQNVAHQLVVTDNTTGSPVGLVAAYNVDHRHGYAYLSIVLRSDASPFVSGEASSMFIEYLFVNLRMRIVLIESANARVGAFVAGSKLATVRVRMNDQWWDYKSDTYHDWVVASIDAADWRHSSTVERLRRGWVHQ